MAITSSNDVKCCSSVKIHAALQKEDAFCYIPMQGRAEATGPALCVRANHNDHSHECKETGHGMEHWSAHGEVQNTLLGWGSRDKELKTGWQEWSYPVWSGKRTGAMSAIPFGVGVERWLLDYIMYLPGGFCERKSSLIRDIREINQSSARCLLLQEKVEKGTWLSQKYHAWGRGSPC